jgi:hypothetical protein
MLGFLLLQITAVSTRTETAKNSLDTAGRVTVAKPKPGIPPIDPEPQTGRKI